MEVVRIDYLMEEWNCTIIDFDRLYFFSWCRKDILCYALFMRELMLSSHFRSWEVLIPWSRRPSLSPLGRHTGRWDLGRRVSTWSPLSSLCYGIIELQIAGTASGHKTVSLAPIGRLISTCTCGVICKLQFDGLVSGGAAFKCRWRNVEEKVHSLSDSIINITYRWTGS